MSSSVSDNGSAARRALHMPELLSAILTNFRVPDACSEVDDSTYASVAEGTAPNSNSSASLAAVAANRAVLFSAALVNRAWCAAVLPLLWRCPPERALSDEFVASPARCYMYARLLRHAHISQDSALLRALVPAAGSGVSDIDGIGDASGAGSGHIRSGGGGVAVRGGGNGRGDGALLPCSPRLTLLHVKRYFSSDVWWWGEDAGEIEGEVLALRRQAPLVGLIDVDLAELRCYLTAAVLDQLMAMSDPQSLAEPLALQNQQQQRRSPIRRPKMMLQRLHLYGRHEGLTAAEHALGQRFITWLARDPSPLLALTSMKLCLHIRHAGSSLADRAFWHFAWRAGLEQLWLSDLDFWRSSIVSQTALEQLIAHVDQHHHPCPPFKDLQDLVIAVDKVSAVPPLARLLSLSSPKSLTRLALAVRSGSYEVVWAAPLLPPLASALPPLRVLLVHLGLLTHVTGADLRALAVLTQLETLELTEGDGSHVHDDDLAAMLCPLHQLRRLVLWFMIPHLADTALRFVGAASPRLRHLACFSKLVLEDANEPDEPRVGMPPTLLFPHLEYLHLGITEPDGTDHASRERLRVLAERRAQRLYAHAPKLRDLGGAPFQRQYDQHLSHVFAELAARRYSLSDAQQACFDERVRLCTLCRALE